MRQDGRELTELQAMSFRALGDQWHDRLESAYETMKLLGVPFGVFPMGSQTHERSCETLLELMGEWLVKRGKIW